MKPKEFYETLDTKCPSTDLELQPTQGCKEHTEPYDFELTENEMQESNALDRAKSMTGTKL